MKYIILFLVVCLVFIVVTASYFGFVPGLSSIMGANKSQNLGVIYSQSDVSAIPTKSYSIPQTSYTTPVNIIFSQSEASAALNTTTWSHHPLTNVQIKFGPNNNIEASGNIVSSRLAGYLQVMGINHPRAEEGLRWLKMVPNPSFYTNGTAEVVDNKIILSVSSLKIGKFTIPSNFIDDNQSYVTSFINQKLNEMPLFYKSIKPDNGQLKIDVIRK